MTGKILRNSYLVAISALLASALLFFGVMYRDYEDEAFARLRAETSAIAQGLYTQGASYFDGFVPSDRVTWVDASGSVLYDSAAPAEQLSNHTGREEIDRALEDGEAQSSRYSQTLLQRTFYYARRMADGTVLRVSCTQNSLPAMVLMLLTPFLWVATVVLILCGVLSYRLAQSITKPINAIHLDRPTPLPGYPELTPLFDKLREQNRTIRFQLTELSRRQQEFSAITEQMREGFLLLDANWDILSGNRSAKTLLALPQDAANLRGASLPPEAARAVEAALSGTHAEALLHLSDGVWQLTANPVASFGRPSGAVLLLMDVTEREEREALRREFSANVSHELKTPLTSISGFAELMKEGLVPPEKMREFSADIYRESSRMIALVDDMNLSRLDEGAALPRTTVDLYTLAEGVTQSLRDAAGRCGVTLRLLGQHEQVEGVEQLLREMLYNLCDNAIKYNVPGGSVTVNVWRNGQHPCVSVSDTGIGIPQADQERIFERFYRVDKSHSKAVGGTGLGLSIVKHAAQYHGAQLELSSAPGRGTSVTVTF